MPKLLDPSRRMPPDAYGRPRFIGHNFNAVYVRVGRDHQLATHNGWVTESRLVALEHGIITDPAQRVFHKDRNKFNNHPDNLVARKTGEHIPWKRKGDVPCACGCGTVLVKRKWAPGHRPTWDTYNDEFSNLPVSRQRKWQLRMMKSGLCQICARPRDNGSNVYCKHHAELQRQRNRIKSGEFLDNPQRYNKRARRQRKWQRDHAVQLKLYQANRMQYGHKRFWPADVLAEYNKVKALNHTYAI